MWITRDRYDTLIRAEVMAEMLRVRVNQLEREKAQVVFERTGVPQIAPEIGKFVVGAAKQKDADEDPNTDDTLSFDDMGDELARKHGITVDESGRLVPA